MCSLTPHIPEIPMGVVLFMSASCPRTPLSSHLALHVRYTVPLLCTHANGGHDMQTFLSSSMACQALGFQSCVDLARSRHRKRLMLLHCRRLVCNLRPAAIAIAVFPRQQAPTRTARTPWLLARYPLPYLWL